MRLLVPLLLIAAVAGAQTRFGETYFFSTSSSFPLRRAPPPLDLRAVEAGEDGSVTFVGVTSAPDLPVTNAWQSNLRGERNAYLGA